MTFHADVERWLDWYLTTGEPRGKAGGYELARPPATISLSEIVQSVEPDLLGGLANCHRVAVGIGFIHTPARKGHMTGPGVAHLFGPLDHQNIQLTLPHLQYHSHCGAFFQSPQQSSTRSVITEAGFDQFQ